MEINGCASISICSTWKFCFFARLHLESESVMIQEPMCLCERMSLCTCDVDYCCGKRKTLTRLFMMMLYNFTAISSKPKWKKNAEIRFGDDDLRS